MLVVTKNTEDTLFQSLKEHWEKQPTHRCLHLKFSQIQDDTKDWLEVLLYELRQVIDDKTAQVYVCHDEDIFIVTRALTQKRADEILAHLSPKLSPALLSSGLASLFEIGVDWPKLRTLVNKKIENLQLLQEQEKKKQQQKIEVAMVKRETALKTIDRDLVSSLSERRAKRETLEIMVVEDDPFSQKLVKNALGKKYSLSMTADGQGAVMSYVGKAPDVLFLDIGLPDINGHEVLKKLFKLDPDAYVVMFSGNGDKENVMKAVELGAKGFVGKPFTQEKLFQYIEKSPFIQEKLNREKTYADTHH